MRIKSSQIWIIVDKWKRVSASDIQKFTMICDLLLSLSYTIEFDTPKRDPVYE
jgi:hypothetical protein